MIRCIQIGTTTAQGPCEIETRCNHNIGEDEPTGYGTIDGIFGRLIQSERNSPNAAVPPPDAASTVPAVLPPPGRNSEERR